jgi:DNA (cytosine-5)-methyltransferase 1
MKEQKKTVIDLFAGVGGLSLGVARAGFELAAAVELDERAAAQHTKNFPNARHLQEDVSKLTGESLLRLASIRNTELCGLVGGPPCQGFSEIGLRGRGDLRNELLVHFFRLVSETRPAFFLAENVPGVAHERNKPVLDRALALVPSDYVVLAPMVVKASNYGAPTIRTRVFFFGYDPRRVKTLQVADFAPKRVDDVRVSRALDGLPTIRSDWQSEEQSWRSVGALADGVYEESITNAIPYGVGDPLALNAYRVHKLVSGFLGTLHTPDTKKRFAALKPGMVDAVSKSVRLRMDGYCPTLRAGTGPERGSYQAIRPIHPSSPRVISPREAARLQGFPDWFQFHPTKWHAFRQIGNSVSPIVSEALMSVIREAV